jgi:hypothetical protein
VTDLVKAVIGGARALIVGWILPIFLALQLATVLILPALRQIKAVDQFLNQPTAARQFVLLAASVVIGLTVAAAQVPLYRVLEGYILWPTKIVDRRIEKHQARRRDLVHKYEKAAKTEKKIHAGLIYERLHRYPVEDSQFAPTTLGNAIRRFETYAGDRYKLDSQLLWHHLTAAAPARAVAAVDNARINADFFVALLYGVGSVGVFGVGVILTGYGDRRVWLAIVASAVVAVACYRLAVLATDAWDAAVRALVDHGRSGVAKAFGLTVPAKLNDERLMWQAVNTLVRRDYSYSESKDVPALIARFRAKPISQRRRPWISPSAVTRAVGRRGRGH